MPGEREFELPLDRVLYGTHDMSWRHVERWRDAFPHCDWPPVRVTPGPPGYWNVDDGRHRIEAAYDLGRDRVRVTDAG